MKLMVKVIIVLSFTNQIIFLHSQPAFSQRIPQGKMDSLLRVVSISGQDTIKVSALLLVAKLLQSEFPDSSKKTAQQALDLSKKLNWQKGIGKSLLYTAQAINLIGNYDQTIELCNASINIFKKIGDKKDLADATACMGVAYYFIANFPEGLNAFYRAKETYQEIDDKEGMGAMYNYIGLSFAMTMQYDSAQKYFKRAMDWNTRIGNKREAALSGVYWAGVYLRPGEVEKAMPYFLDARKVFEEIQDNFQWAMWTEVVGNMYLTMKQDSLAMHYLFDALDTAKRSDHEGGLVMEIQSSIAEAYFKMSADTALPYYADLLIPHDKDLLRQKAIAYVNASIDAGNKLKTPWLNRLNYILLSNIQESMGNYGEALENYKLYTKSNDTLFKMSNRDKMTLVQKQREMEVKEKELEIQNLKVADSIRQRWYFVAGIILLLFFSAVLYNRYRLKQQTNKQLQRLAVLEKQYAVEHERQRISRDMHDELGSGISVIRMMSDLMGREQLNPKLQGEVEKISSVSNELMQQLREIVWTLNPQNDFLKNLLVYLRQYAIGFFSSTPIECIVKLPPHIPDLPVSGELRRTLFLVQKESLNNLLKHSQAKRANIEMIIDQYDLVITISDDGFGIDESKVNSLGNGIRNMRKRMEEVRGGFQIDQSNGTTIRLTVSLNPVNLNGMKEWINSGSSTFV